ncbi:ortho-aminophenol oxidase [Ectocarpus siliculosus]|uniref:Ortho-aminophenol oxidase n=1 Tax=Ectocarpus siliculosus TaxID=2880 RepID=D8LC43_ECTSI|nr:ortho-aminophenol oxidase [Ectocarpus siliculosus]|eukprot:CBN79226.1 ortho-aminophenol oxidase [Ectocarpus siliculosus]
MSPQYARRKYGSVEDPTKSRRAVSPTPTARGDDAGAAERVSFDFDPTRALRGESPDDQGGGKRWFTLTVVGVLAVGVMMALTHAGYRLPKVTRTTTDVGSQGHTPSLIRADEAKILPSEDLAVEDDEKKQQVARPFPIADVSPRAEDETRPAEDGQLSGEEIPRLSFEATNFYQLRDGKPAQDYPWLKDVKLIEPHRETTFTVSSPRDGFDYRWRVFAGSPAEGELCTEATGPEGTVVLTTLDENAVVLEEVDADGTVVRRLQEMVMVKYVRREIRTLTDDEREELFDAMFTLWSVRVDGGNGKELYGDDYADIFAINRLHYKGASPKQCDHFHDGLGFLTSHIVITNTFEASLQAVNPKLTLPYWDFTIETSTAGTKGDGGYQSQTKSDLFQESWFGTADPTDGQVKDGRWAYTEIPKMKVNDPGAVEPDVYSKLRAPWNVNDRPYLTRGMGKMCDAKVDEWYPWPTCETHYDLATGYSDFYSWVWYSLYDPHGPVHIWIGGVLDCEKTFGAIAELVGPSIAEDLALYSFIHRKNLFRDGIFSCVGSATVVQAPAEVLSSGQCGCQGYDLTQGDDYESIYYNMVDLDDLIGDFDADVKRQVVAALCTTTMNDGDHLQASSSLDPSFYATHPTMERLWMYAVLTGQITDFTWPDDDVTITKPDGTVEVESLSLSEDACQGHGGSDVFPFGLLDSDTDGFEVKTGVKGMENGNTLTNRELLQAFDARSNSVSYVYDTFKWTHCEADGFDFDDAWNGAAQARPTSSSRRPSFKQGAPRAPMYNILEEKRAARAAKKAANLIN